MPMLNNDLATFFPKLGISSLYNYQEQTINKIMDGKNSLCIVQTGGGKSLTYWMCAAKLGGITLVISPLIALISEQVRKLNEQGYDAIAFPGNMSATKQLKAMKNIANGEYSPDYIFASPEKIATDGFLEFCLKKRKDDIKLLVIDEIHCVSQWGISFRPFYKRIPEFINNVFGSFGITTLGLTATINPKELGDICSAFNISNENIVKQDLLARTEIALHTKKFANEVEKEEKFWDILETHHNEKILVYVYRVSGKNSVEDLCEKATQKGYKATYFHGDMSAEKREEIIQAFKNDEISIVFATNAFGMGIDIPDIKVVIHFLIPESLEQYYQEVGRAARKNDISANAYLLYSNKNIDVKRKFFIEGSFPDENTLRDVYSKIASSVGYHTLAYFDDEEIQHCLPYYLESGLVRILGKGFSTLKNVSDSSSEGIKNFISLTKTKGIIMTAKKAGIEPTDIANQIYEAYLTDNILLSKPFDKVLILEVLYEVIPEDIMKNILDCISQKLKYKYGLLDYMVYAIESNKDSVHLHQEIAFYLGANRFNLNKIHTTKDGNLVRSKSEVIISNLLSDSKIKYEYEKPLYYGDKHILPDFTIELPNGDEIYWEHFGMLGVESYDNDTKEKLEVYEKYFPGKLVKTYESGILSKEAANIIKEILNY